MIFDAARFKLGTLCARGHDDSGDGRSLRYLKTPNCVQCAKDARRTADAERARLREAAKVKPPDGERFCVGCRASFPLHLFKPNGIRQARCQPCASKWQKDYRARKPSGSTRFARRATIWAEILVAGSKSSAKARGLAHEIDAEEVRRLYVTQGSRCHWLGVELDPSAGKRHPLRPSLDRLDNALGYVKGNVVISSSFANLGRSTCDAAEFARVVDAVFAAKRAAA